MQLITEQLSVKPMEKHPKHFGRPWRTPEARKSISVRGGKQGIKSR